jgi:hypothetical protein
MRFTFASFFLAPTPSVISLIVFTSARADKISVVFGAIKFVVIVHLILQNAQQKFQAERGTGRLHFVSGASPRPLKLA